MTTKQINVVFLYKPCDALEPSGHYYSYEYHFFFSALKRNNRINVTYLKTGANFDASGLNNKYDVILLYENSKKFNGEGYERRDQYHVIG